MGIRDDLAASQAYVDEFVGVSRAVQAVAEYERVSHEETARWMLAQGFIDGLAAYYVAEDELTVKAMQYDDREEEVGSTLRSFLDNDGHDLTLSDVAYWHMPKLLQLLRKKGVSLSESALQRWASACEDEGYSTVQPSVPSAGDDSTVQAEMARLADALQTAQAEIERMKSLAPPRPDARLMAAVIATQRQFWADWKDGEPRPKSEEAILPWIKQHFSALSDADARAVDRVACPVDRNPASRGGGN